MTEIVLFGAVVAGLAAFGLFQDSREHRDEKDQAAKMMKAYNLLADVEKEKEKALYATR